MGWAFWASSSGEKPATIAEPAAVESAAREPSQAPPSSPPPRRLSRDEQAELELQDLLAQVSSEAPGPSSPSSGAATAGAPPSPPASIAPDSLYPTTMSCRQAFDSAFYCQSMGGQFNNVYRYGGIKDCGEHWGAFWFCMRNKSYGDAERARRVQSFYRGRAAKYKVGPSSEDVWEVRREPVEGAFSMDPDAVQEGGAEASG